MSSNNSLCIIIPMYNEEANAEKCVREVCRVLQRPELAGTQLIVVNDGSRDRTGELLGRLDNENLPLIIENHPVNQGYGAALLTGARVGFERGFEYGLFMDSDLTNDPELIPLFAKKLKDGNFDVIKASRYISGGGMKGVPWNRQLVTIVGNQIASRLFNMGIKDCTNGFRAVRLKLLQGMRFEERGFPLIVEELYLLKKKGAKATEIPYTLTNREGGESSFRYTAGTFYRYFKYAWKAAFVPSDHLN